jgi:hypothetical protein
MKKMWDGMVTAKDLYVEIMDWLGPDGVGLLWPLSIAAVVYFMWG